MRVLSTVFFAVGLIALAVGLLWIGQGTGVVAWPASSFMIRDMTWAYFGGVLGLVGLVLIVTARRM